MENYEYGKVLKTFQQYSGIPVIADDCKWTLKENEHFVCGFRLTNPIANYKLLSENDLNSLSEDQRNWCIENQRSIFEDILIVFFYEDDNPDEVFFKTINGMASKLMYLL